MMPYQPTSGSLILRGVLVLGLLVAESDQSHQLDMVDHLAGVTQGGPGPHSIASQFCLESIFWQICADAASFWWCICTTWYMYMDCTNIFDIYIYMTWFWWLYMCMDVCDAYVWIYVMLTILTLVMQDVMWCFYMLYMMPNIFVMQIDGRLWDVCIFILHVMDALYRCYMWLGCICP